MFELSEIRILAKIRRKSGILSLRGPNICTSAHAAEIKKPRLRRDGTFLFPLHVRTPSIRSHSCRCSPVKNRKPRRSSPVASDLAQRLVAHPAQPAPQHTVFIERRSRFTTAVAAHDAANTSGDTRMQSAPHPRPAHSINTKGHPSMKKSYKLPVANNAPPRRSNDRKRTPLQSGLHSLSFEIRAFTTVADDFQFPIPGKSASTHAKSQQPYRHVYRRSSTDRRQHLLALCNSGTGRSVSGLVNARTFESSWETIQSRSIRRRYSSHNTR